jgi:hypothetical protein
MSRVHVPVGVHRRSQWPGAFTGQRVSGSSVASKARRGIVRRYFMGFRGRLQKQMLALPGRNSVLGAKFCSDTYVQCTGLSNLGPISLSDRNETLETRKNF